MNKLSFRELYCGMAAFLYFPEVEDFVAEEARQKADTIQEALNRVQGNDSVEKLASLLHNTSSEEADGRIRIILGLTNSGSLELIKRVALAMFPDTTWRKVQTDSSKLRRLLSFIEYPETERELIKSRFIRQNFGLPTDWKEMLGTPAHMRRVLQNDLRSTFAAKTGFALEEEIQKVVTRAGYTFEKGKVQIVDDKEVDVAIPDRHQPRLLLMSSYMLTTSSAQTTRANEQKGFYETIERYNRHRGRRNDPNILLVNVIDGGGWMARQNDLKVMHEMCDYVFAFSQLHRLENVLSYHLG